jgi:hypothetical protein
MLDEGEGGGDFLMSHVEDMDVDGPGQGLRGMIGIWQKGQVLVSKWCSRAKSDNEKREENQTKQANLPDIYPFSGYSSSSESTWV